MPSPSIATFARWRQAVAAPPRPPTVLTQYQRRCIIPRGGFAAAAAAAANAPRRRPTTTTSAAEASDDDETDDAPAGYIVRPGPRGRAGGSRGAFRGVIPAPEPASAERAAVAAAVALAAAAAAAAATEAAPRDDEDEDDDDDDDEEWADDEEFGDADNRSLLAPQRTPRPAIPPHLSGLARDSGRPWQRAEIRRLLSATAAARENGDGGFGGDASPAAAAAAAAAAAPSLYARMTAPRLKRVLDARVACETDARRLLEEARWQRERAEGWGRLAAGGDDGADATAAAAAPAPSPAALPGGPRLLDFTVRTGLAEVADLASECGAAEARLAALVAAAASYRDGGYARRQGPALRRLLRRVRAFCDHYREATAPALERALAGVQARARAGRREEEEEEGGAWGGRRRTTRTTPPSPPFRLAPGWLPPPLPKAEEAVEWRYPPAEYVVFRRKGEPGARARAHPLAPAMRERAERASAEASRRAARRAFGEETAAAAAATRGGGGGGGLFDD